MMPDNLVWCRRCKLVKPIVKEDVHTPIFLFPKNSQVAEWVDAAGGSQIDKRGVNIYHEEVWG